MIGLFAVMLNTFFGETMRMEIPENIKIAVLIPCLNEEITIGKVVDDFKRELPSAKIYVFDNNSTDASARIAAEHGGIMLKEPRRGKGFVVESMFERVEADIYVMVDGDDTYSAAHVHKLLKPVLAGDADMAIGVRLADHTDKSFPSLHLLGNVLIRGAINWIFHACLTDIFSGYRVFNRRVVEKIPVVSKGFEIETEMTIQMLYYQIKIVEVNVPYQERPVGSRSKLRTFRDGFRVGWQLFRLFRSFKPLTFFGGMGLILMFFGILAGIPPLRDYLSEQYVRHIPLAVLASSLIILSFGSIFLGILLHALNWRFRELHNILTRRLLRPPS